jgi:hypothetical protein
MIGFRIGQNQRRTHQGLGMNGPTPSSPSSKDCRIRNSQTGEAKPSHKQAA